MSQSNGVPWSRCQGGLVLQVRLTPKSSKDALEGLARQADGKCYLAARVRAVPEKGAANKALTKLTAKTLGLPKSAISLASGSTSRIKTLRLEGDPDAIEAALRELLEN